MSCGCRPRSKAEQLSWVGSISFFCCLLDSLHAGCNKRGAGFDDHLTEPRIRIFKCALDAPKMNMTFEGKVRNLNVKTKACHLARPRPSVSLSKRGEGAIRSGEKSTRMRIGEERGRARRRAGQNKTEERGMVNPE